MSMAQIEALTADIKESKCAAVVRKTCLPGGEEMYRVLEDLDAAYAADGPEWTDENKEKGKVLYDCYLSIFKDAAENGTEELDIAAVPTGIYNSELFQAATQAMRALKEHMKESDLPKTIRFICDCEEVTNMYKTAYNYWLAIEHDKRMEVPHHHD